jgi:hypothetical protein
MARGLGGTLVAVKRKPSQLTLGSHWAGAYREVLWVAAAADFSWQLHPQVEDPPQPQREQPVCPLLARNGVMPREGFSS